MTVCWPANAADGLRVPPAPVLGRERSALWNHRMELVASDGDAAPTSTPMLMKARCFRCCTLLAVYLSLRSRVPD